MVGMLFIIGALLLILGTLLCMRDAHQRGNSILRFLFPLISLSYVQSHWQDVRWAVMCRIVGVAMLLLAVGLTVVRQPELLQDPFSLVLGTPPPSMAGSLRADLDGFVGAEEAIRRLMRADGNPRLSGRVHGRRFDYQRVEWIDGVLVARQGEGFLPDLEVRIVFPEDPGPIRSRTVFHVIPGDQQVPEVYLTWREPGASHPETLIVRTGYRMELQLAPLDRHMLSGFMRLILPDPERSFLSGDFRAYRSHLRHQDGRVDLSFDHPDTLEYAVGQFLDTQYPDGAIAGLVFHGTELRRASGTGSTTALVTLRDGRVEERSIGLERTEVGWTIRPGTMETRVLEGAQRARARAADQPEAAGEDEVMLPPRAVAFADLADYAGSAATIIRVDGTRQQGILRGMRRDRVFLEASVGSGTIEFFVTERELAEVILSGGQRLLIEGRETAGEAQPAVTPVQPDAPSQEQEQDKVLPWQEFEGKVVRIVTTEGRARTGVLTRVEPRQLTLEVNIGSGVLEYFYRPSEISTLERVER